MSQDRAEELRSVLRDGLLEVRKEAETDQDIQQRRIQQFNGERKKLLDAYYSGAVPMDLMRSEQDRIATALKAAEQRLANAAKVFDGVEVTLERAIGWACDLPRAYRAADEHGRRRLNQAVFKRLWVFDDGIASYEFTDGMEILFERRPVVVPVPPRAIGVPRQHEPYIRRTMSNDGPFFDRGLNVVHLVEVMRGLSNPLNPASSLIRGGVSEREK